MRIGLLGFGTVGKGVYELVSARQDMQVAEVLCRRPLTLDGTPVTHDFQDILQDPSIDTVVEVIGGLHPAFEYVSAALEAGKNVVTANKALIANYYDTLLPQAQRKGVSLRCTAAVGGGIGWLSEVERVRRCEAVSQVSGIMNGTCNYILDSMTRLGLGYAQALFQAQELGYAEADPSTDIDGVDTWHKLIVSANIAFGVSLDVAKIPCAGIRHISAEDVASFTDHSLVCKLVASAAAQDDGSFSAWVQPTLYPNGQPEAAVPTNYNLISLVGDISGRKSFFGQGAGRYPTASNVVQDCVDILSGKGFYSSYGPKASVNNERQLSFYVRAEQDAWLQAHTSESWGNGVITVPVPVTDMHKWLSAHPGAFIAAFGDPI